MNSVSDAVSELPRLGDEAKIYAGGTELLILLRHNLLQTEYLAEYQTDRRIECDSPSETDGVASALR